MRQPQCSQTNCIIESNRSRVILHRWLMRTEAMLFNRITFAATELLRHYSSSERTNTLESTVCISHSKSNWILIYWHFTRVLLDFLFIYLFLSWDVRQQKNKKNTICFFGLYFLSLIYLIVCLFVYSGYVVEKLSLGYFQCGKNVSNFSMTFLTNATSWVWLSDHISEYA